MCRFNLEELRDACGDVSDVDVTTLPESRCPLADNVGGVDRNMDEVGDIAESMENSDTEVVSNGELEEVYEFVLTQRQPNSDGPEPRDVPSRESDVGETDSEDDDDEFGGLSQALLRKLEESFAAELAEDGVQISVAATPEVNPEICDRRNGSPTAVELSDSERLVIDSDTEKVDDDAIDSLSATEEHRGPVHALSGEIGDSCVPGNVVGDTDAPQTSNCLAEDSEMKDLLGQTDRQKEGSLSADEPDQVMPDQPDVCDFVAVQSPSGDDDGTCCASNWPSTLQPSSGVQSTAYSAQSPPSLFEDSSVEQCDLERLGASEAVDQRSSRCESPNDLFDSPSSARVAVSPADSPPQEQSDDAVARRRCDSVPRPASSPARSPRRQLDFSLQQCKEALQSLSKSMSFSPPEASQKPEEMSTKWVSTSTTTTPEAVTEVETRTLDRSHSSAALRPSAGHCSEEQGGTGEGDSRPAAVALEVDLTEETEELPDDQLARFSPKSDAAKNPSLSPVCRRHSDDVVIRRSTVAQADVIEVSNVSRSSALNSSVGHCRRSAAGEESITPKRFGLRKVRAKTRNSLLVDISELPRYTSKRVPSSSFQTGKRRKSRHVNSDVEPDSDDDDRRATSTSRGACQSQSTQACYVKLTRLKSGDLLPQVRPCTRR